MHERKPAILIALRDKDLQNSIKLLLKSAGYKSSTAASGMAVLELTAKQHFDLILLDTLMTGMNGYRITRQLRANSATWKLPIIMISESGKDSDELKCLETGADDCIRKPVNMQILLARINACLRRIALPDPDRIEVDKLIIDRSSRSVSIDSRNIKLSGVEFDMLWLLARNAGNVLSREYIYYAMRGLKFDGQDRAIDMRISRLRKLLGDSIKPYKIIISVRNKGYLFSSNHDAGSPG